MDKSFDDMFNVERRNRFGRVMWFKHAEQVKRNAIEEPLIEDADPVNLSDLLSLFRSNTSLYDKLDKFIKVTPFNDADRAWLVTPSIFSSYINSAEKMQFQYNQIISTVESYIYEDFVEFDKKDVDKIVKTFEALDNSKKKFFNRIGFEMSPDGVSSSIVSPVGEKKKVGQSDPDRMEQPIKEINDTLYRMHDYLYNMMLSYSNRQRQLGGSAIPHKYM